MPKFRSVTVSIVSQWELRLHPEFRHPHSEKSRIPSSKQRVNVRNDPNEGFDYNDDDVQEYSYSAKNGKPAQVSVYIPSCPGTRFWIRYTIAPDHPPAKLFYFKLYLNGRHITSWGMNPRQNSRGQVMRALFNPEHEENYRPAGIQSRPFFFAPDTQHEVGADGGLIEIRVFRAKGRRLRAADPVDFRKGQEKYGLDLPRGALLDCPEDARFYDWLLVDPKDSPYAAFRFHYRSWEHLVALSLIPPQIPRTLLTRTPSMWSIRDKSRPKNEGKQEVKEVHKVLESHEESTLTAENSGPLAQGFSQLSDGDVNMNSPDRHLMNTSHSRSLPAPGSNASSKRHSYTDDRPPTPFMMSSNASRKNSPSPRMLPAPPQQPQNELRRTSSQASTAHSITPSLRSYIDRESIGESPEPFVGEATAVSILYSSSIDDDSYLPEGYSLLSVESPQRQNIHRSNYGITRPPEAMFPPESAAPLRQSKGDIDCIPNVRATSIPTAPLYHDRFKVQTDHAKSPGDHSNGQGQYRGDYESTSQDEDESTIGLAVSDLSFRTPSPVTRNHEHIRIEGVWSPGNGAIEDLEVPQQSNKEALEYGELRDRTNLPLPIPRKRVGLQRRIRTWI